MYLFSFLLFLQHLMPINLVEAIYESCCFCKERVIFLMVGHNNLKDKVNLEWEFQKQSNSGKTIVEKAKGKKMAKFHNYMTVKTLLR